MERDQKDDHETFEIKKETIRQVTIEELRVVSGGAKKETQTDPTIKDTIGDA